MSTYEFSGPCLFGLEGLAGEELRRLGMENVRVENGRVLFSGDALAMAKANVCLRTGERVLVVLADFPANTFDDLFQGVYRSILEDYIPMENVRVENGRVLFSGDALAMAKANVCLRTGERVLVVLADFPAKTFEELFQGVYRTNLEDYIPKNGCFPVKGHCLSSQLMSVPDCQAIIKKAASKRLS